MRDSFAIPNLSFLFVEKEPGSGTPACRVCGRVIAGNGGPRAAHARTHLADGSVEAVTFPEPSGEPVVVGYRTPGAAGFFAVWIDSAGNERPAVGSVGTHAVRILADNLYYMGLSARKVVRPIGHTRAAV